MFWPKITYPTAHREVYDLPGVWKVPATHSSYKGAIPTSMAHIGNRFVLLEKNGLSDSCRCLFQVHPSEEIAQFHFSSCMHRVTITVTKLGLPHIIKSDNGPCYNSKEFPQFLQCYSITHQTSSPNHPRSNGFIERMVGVAKKLMDKAGKEGKPWISGLFDYRVTPQSGSIASPLQLMTQCTPREKNLSQLPSALGAPEMDQKCTRLARNSSGGKVASLRGSTKNCSLVHQFGCNTGRMLHGNQQ